MLVFILLLTSCYTYGPSHIPYGSSERIALPPPPAKVIAPPLSKSEYLLKTYKEIKSTLVEAEVVMIEDSIKVLFPNNIIYKSKDILPSSEYMQPLEKFSILLKKFNKTNILVAGHSDNKGNEVKNKELSKVRAQNIKSILVTKGISDTRMEAWGVGSVSPIDDNSTESGRLRNRRVEFVVLYDE